MEAVFAQARGAEVGAKELLVDKGWHAVEVEPVPASIRIHCKRSLLPAGVEAGNGYHDEPLESQ